MGSGSHFLRLKSLATTNFFGLGHAGPQIFSAKRFAAFFSLPTPTAEISATRAWEVARLLLADTFLTARGVAFPNTLSDLSISSRNNSTVPRFLRIACCLAPRVPSLLTRLLVQVAHQHLIHFPEQFFVPPSACCVPHSRHVRDRARARARARGRAGLSALVPLPFLLLVFNFQARRSCRARFSESSEPKGRFGRADPHCRGEPSSQHARSRALLLLKDPAAADSCAADAHRPAVDDVFGQACCRRCFRRGLPSFTAADAGEPAALGADEPAVPSDDRHQQSRPQQQRSSSRPAVLQPQ